MKKKELQLLYCKWCPRDCAITEEDKLACFASGGFVDDYTSNLTEEAVATYYDEL